MHVLKIEDAFVAMTINARLAAKAFIVDGGKLLLIKRRPNDVHGPGMWDIPGGRLEPGENPYDGLQRETKEETGLTIDVGAPLDVHHFTRDDGQIITMLIFICRPQSRDVHLSEEHTDFVWAALPDDAHIPEWLRHVVDRYMAHFHGR